MSFKLFSFALLACIAAVQSAKLFNGDNTDVMSTQREGRILEVPALDLEVLVYKGLQITWFVITSVWSIVGYKLAAVALLSNVAIWIVQNCFSAVIGAALTLAFCKLSGKCTLNYDQEYEEYHEDLSYAAKHLEDGATKFSF